MIRSFENNGRFYFDDGRRTIETVELIDCNLVVYDRLFGYIYKSKTIDEYEKKDWFARQSDQPGKAQAAFFLKNTWDFLSVLSKRPKE